MIKKSRSVIIRLVNKANTKHGFWAYSPREKMQNCIWLFKIGDPDDNPSVPHAHAAEYGYRLNAWTGEIFPAGAERKNTIGQLKRKELNKLHSDKQFLDFSKRQIEWYKKTYPNIHFYVPEWFETKLKTAVTHSGKVKIENDSFTFIAEARIYK